MQRGDVLSVYCPRLEMLLERQPGSQSDRFPNLELVETSSFLNQFFLGSNPIIDFEGDLQPF